MRVDIFVLTRAKRNSFWWRQECRHFSLAVKHCAANALEARKCFLRETCRVLGVGCIVFMHSLKIKMRQTNERRRVKREKWKNYTLVTVNGVHFASTQKNLRRRIKTNTQLFIFYVVKFLLLNGFDFCESLSVHSMLLIHVYIA